MRNAVYNALWLPPGRKPPAEAPVALAFGMGARYPGVCTVERIAPFLCDHVWPKGAWSSYRRLTPFDLDALDNHIEGDFERVDFLQWCDMQDIPRPEWGMGHDCKPAGSLEQYRRGETAVLPIPFAPAKPEWAVWNWNNPAVVEFKVAQANRAGDGAAGIFLDVANVPYQLWAAPEGWLCEGDRSARARAWCRHLIGFLSRLPGAENLINLGGLWSDGQSPGPRNRICLDYWLRYGWPCWRWAMAEGCWYRLASGRLSWLDPDLAGWKKCLGRLHCKGKLILWLLNTSSLPQAEARQAYLWAALTSGPDDLFCFLATGCKPDQWGYLSPALGRPLGGLRLYSSGLAMRKYEGGTIRWDRSKGVEGFSLT